jgi:two-component system sensor histidine kinase UhpB
MRRALPLPGGQAGAAPPRPLSLAGAVPAALGPALLVAVAYYAGARLGLTLRFPGLPTSVLWPPNTILLVALLLAPPWPGWWAGLLLAALPAHLLALAPAGPPPATLLLLFGSNAALGVLGAAGVRRALGGPPRFDSRRDVAVFLVWAAAVAPVVTSFPDAAVVVLSRWGVAGGADFWAVWWARASSNALTVLALGPVLLLGITGGVAWVRASPGRRLTEAGLLALAVSLSGLVVFGHDALPARSWPGGDGAYAAALLYVPLPLLLWAAVRFGPGGASGALLAFALLATWGTATGGGPLAGMDPASGLLALQGFLALAGAPLLLLAALVREQQRTAAALRANASALRASEAVVRRSREEVRALAGRLLLAQEEERRRLARELHDDVDQQVAALAIGLGALKRQLPPGAPAGEEVEALQEGARALAEDVRRVSRRLHPAVLEHAGLPAALEAYAAELGARSGLSIRLDLPGPDAPGGDPESPAAWPREVTLALYRVAQEALANVVRHAGATRAEVRLAVDGAEARLRVADDGAGFDPEVARHKGGLGLQSMAERVRLLAGRLEVTSAPGGGTTVLARVPLGPASPSRDGP